MKICKKIELLISMEIDQEIPEQEKEILNQHLVTCSKCRAKKEKFLKLKKAFNSNLKFYKTKKAITPYKKIILSAIAATIILISTFIFSIYSINKNQIYYIEYSKETPMSSFVIQEDTKKNDYDIPMSSFVTYLE